MKKQLVFLTLEQVLVIHEYQIEKYGGSHGVKSLALLESAIFRPQTTFGGQDLYDSVFDKAGALMHSLIFNHPFVDGNKRTATASTIVFLELNGYKFIFPELKLAMEVVNIENKKWTNEKIKMWLQKHSKKIQ